MDIVEQESLQPRPKLQDPDMRNGLKSRRLQPATELKDAALPSWGDIQGNPTDNANLLALIGNFQVNLGYNPLRPSLNLSDVLNPATARHNLGLDSGGDGDIWLHTEGGQLEGTLILVADLPLRFQSSILPSAQKGHMEYDGHKAYFTQAKQRRAFNYISDVIVAPVVVTNTTTETDVFTALLDETSLDVKQILKVLLYGRYTGLVTDTFTLRFKINNTTILSIVSTAAAVTDAPFFAEMMNTLRVAGSSGELWTYIRGLINNVNKDKPGTSLTSIDTTGDNTLKVTVQWSAANAGNIFTLDQALLNMD